MLKGQFESANVLYIYRSKEGAMSQPSITKITKLEKQCHYTEGEITQCSCYTTPHVYACMIIHMGMYVCIVLTSYLNFNIIMYVAIS